MDYSPIINQVLKLWWLVPILVVLTICRTRWFKGVVGETLVKLIARLGLPAEVYHPFHNVTLPTPEGTTQIDHVFVSRFGIFVVETKNMKGWIFGGESQAQWTQKIFGKSYRFQNPLRQNYKHMKALQAALDLPPEAVHSVVVFVGDSQFKTPMPANVTRGGSYTSHIKSFQNPVLNEWQVQQAVTRLEAKRLEPTRETHRQHVQQLKARVARTAERKCPGCGSSMVLRAAKRGTNTGKQFWGCSTFPACRVVQNIH